MGVDTQRYALRGLERARFAAALWALVMFPLYRTNGDVVYAEWLVGATAAGFLVISNLTIRRAVRTGEQRTVTRVASGLVIVDGLLATAVILYFSVDAVADVLWTLLLLPVVESAVLHRVRGALWTCAGAGVAMLLHALVTGRVPTGQTLAVDLAYRCGLLALVAVAVGLLADSLLRVLEELHRAREEATQRALHDGLTGLPNRTLFVQRVQEALVGPPSGRGEGVALLFVDLDDFKAVNDTLGHRAGDDLLVELAGRLRDCLEPGDVTARFGGDEFALLVRGPRRAVGVADRVLAALRRPVTLTGTTVTVLASVGIAVAEPGADAASLLADADAAMYEAKIAGKGGWRAFDPSLRGLAETRLRLRGDLVGAADHGDLRIVYQPIVTLDGGRLVAVEALLRWRHPERGTLAPGDFIPLAEETGLIVPVGRWLLHRACAQLRDWQVAHPAAAAGLSINVNVSGVQVRDPDLVADVRGALEATGVDPARLTLELTETVPLLDDDEALARLADLRRLGVRVTLDDFGTGHAALAWLQRLPVDGLKVAREFVADVAGPPPGAAIAGSVLDLARAYGVTAVAEGIEEPAQAVALRGLGCDLGQGYLFGAPMEPTGVAALLGAPGPAVTAVR